MDNWRKLFKFDPIPPMLAAADTALHFFVQRNLLQEPVGPVDRLWHLPEAQRLFRKQQADGSWPRPGKSKHPAINEALIETFRQFRFCVEQYGFTREDDRIRKAAEFLFSCQTEAGDFRGILANQYATYYTGAILSLLIQAGYEADPRTERCFQWLLSMRQIDGGWTIPILTHKLDRATQYRLTSEDTDPLEPDRSKPFSHHWTGMVLRAFAVHPVYQRSEAARRAASLLKSRFFQPDAYTSYQAASYWLRFQYPFWWTNLVTALDSISLIGLPKEDEHIAKALDWLVEHQEPDGLWNVSYAKPDESTKVNAKTQAMRRWVSLAICRVFVRFYGC